MKSDCVYLEDESGRIRLVGYASKLATVVTGITLALKGRVLAGGDFEVRLRPILGDFPRFMIIAFSSKLIPLLHYRLLTHFLRGTAFRASLSVSGIFFSYRGLNLVQPSVQTVYRPHLLKFPLNCLLILSAED